MPLPLLHNFYTELSSDHSEGSADFSCTIRLNPNHPVYAGHFEQMPIAPGVCLTQVIKELLAGKLQKELMMISGDNIKFLAMINPTENTDFSIHFLVKPREEGLEVTASYSHNGVIYLKFKGRFRDLATTKSGT